MGKLKSTEAVCLAAAAACLTLALSVGCFNANAGERVHITPADRSQSIWQSTYDAEEPSLRAAGENIDINTADAQTLALLPGIGEVLASRIIQYREENGAFRDIEEIMDVSGIGQVTFDKLKNYITTEESP